MGTLKQQLDAERDMPHATTDMLQAAAKRRAAAGIEDDTKTAAARAEAPKGRRARPADTA